MSVAVHPFDADTAIRPVVPGHWEATVHERWFNTGGGPHGGFLGALAVRAAEASAERPLRTIALQYLREADPGRLDVRATLERAGRSVSFVSVRLEQDGRPVVLALATLAELAAQGAAWDHAAPPDVPPLEAATRGRSDDPDIPPFVRNFSMRRAIGPPLADWSPGDAAAGVPPVVGGWIRLAEPRALDAPLAVAMLDSWAPSAWVAYGATAPTPTLDLTVHIRRPLPPPDMTPADHALCRFSTRLAVAGTWEEDGELWSPGGQLLAHSRQLALLRGSRA